VQHGFRGHRHERATVVIGDELHTGRERSIAVDLLDLGLHAGHDVVGVQGTVHHHDGGHNVVVLVTTRSTEPRHVADINFRHIADVDGHTVNLRKNDVLDVVDFPSLRQVIGAATVDQADTSNVHGLLADADLAPANVDVGVTDGAHHLL